MELQIIYALYCSFLVVVLVLAKTRTNTIFHPYFAFVTMMCYYISDFLVRGYDDQNLKGISDSLIASYALLVLVILAISSILPLLIRDRTTERAIRENFVGLQINGRLRSVIFVFGASVLLLELYKRGSTVNWDVTSVWMQSLAARGQRDWDVLAYTGNFIFSLISIMLPLGATAMAFFLVAGSAVSRTIAVPFYVTYLIILITDGSRTPFVISVVTLWMFWVIKKTRFTSRLIATAVTVTIIAFSISLMYHFRGSGFLESPNGFNSFGLVYHQDDNFYRTIATMHYADMVVNESWDPYEFFYSILVNPIPRVFWPEKPALDEDFYGGFKLWYTTIFFIGEFAAMFDPTGAFLISPIYMFCLYFLLYRSARLLNKPFGIGAYGLICLYVYMCMRSIMSLTSFSYMPAAATLLVLLMSKLKDKRKQRLAKTITGTR